jgi:hypothetical protein
MMMMTPLPLPPTMMMMVMGLDGLKLHFPCQMSSS